VCRAGHFESLSIHARSTAAWSPLGSDTGVADRAGLSFFRLLQVVTIEVIEVSLLTAPDELRGIINCAPEAFFRSPPILRRPYI